jgi:hypothetical protein
VGFDGLLYTPDRARFPVLKRHVKMTPEEALAQADQEVRKIYQKWQDPGKI